MLRELRLQALRTDPDAFGSSYEREVDRPDTHWKRWASQSSTGFRECIFVAESGGRLVGMAGAYTPEDELRVRHLFGMWVAPATRSVGIGSDLTEAIITWSTAGGARKLTLWVVDANRVARRLYERAGFSKTGVVQPLPSNPSLTESLMSLSLDQR